MLAELHPVQRGVVAVGGEQFRMGSRFDDLAGVEHDDAIRILDRGKPVRDDEDGAPLQQMLDRVLDEPLRLRIASSRSLPSRTRSTR